MNMQKNCSTAIHDEGERGEGEAWDLNPLNDLVEAANRSKSLKLTSSTEVELQLQRSNKAKGKDELQL